MLQGCGCDEDAAEECIANAVTATSGNKSPSSTVAVTSAPSCEVYSSCIIDAGCCEYEKDGVNMMDAMATYCAARALAGDHSSNECLDADEYAVFDTGGFWLAVAVLFLVGCCIGSCLLAFLAKKKKCCFSEKPPCGKPPEETPDYEEQLKQKEKEIEVLQEELDGHNTAQPPSDLVKAATSHLEFEKVPAGGFSFTLSASGAKFNQQPKYTDGTPQMRIARDENGQPKRNGKPNLLQEAIGTDVDEIALVLSGCDHKVRMSILQALFRETQRQNEKPEVHQADDYVKGFQAPPEAPPPPPVVAKELYDNKEKELEDAKKEIEKKEKELKEAQKSHWFFS